MSEMVPPRRAHARAGPPRPCPAAARRHALRRLYRKTHATFADFARDVFNKSRPTVYEEMTSYAIGELLSARADIPSIGKKAAGALNPITKDYGSEASVAVHESIKDATGKTITVKAITRIVQQVPRKEDKELSAGTRYQRSSDPKAADGRAGIRAGGPA